MNNENPDSNDKARYDYHEQTAGARALSAAFIMMFGVLQGLFYGWLIWG